MFRTERELREFCACAVKVKGCEPVQLAAFWLEALWMAMSSPQARGPRWPSQKERHELGMQAESKGRV